MKKSTNTGSALKTWLKNAFTKNLALKIVSLIFAMLLWGYVLMSENPQRTKTLTNVPISVEGGADLIARKLVLSGDKDYGSVTVRVSTQLTSYSDLTADDITASINLSNITATGEHEVIITARSAIGTTVSVSPDHIKVNVDNLVSRSIPVEIDLEGELDEGYWAGDVIYSRNMIDIEGPLEYVSRIDSAKGVLNIDSATSSINKSVLLTLYDNEGNELDADLFYSKLPSVTARMEVLPMKTVPIDVESAIQGKDNIPKNYELVGYGVNVALSDVFAKGGEGGIDLAKEVIALADSGESKFAPIYPLDMSLKGKIETIAKEIYGADGVNYTKEADKALKEFEELGYGNLPICMAKTQYSFSDDPALLGRPSGFKITIRNCRIAAGAGFIVVLTGDVMTMPGLPKVPAAEKIDVTDDGVISGLF